MTGKKAQAILNVIEKVVEKIKQTRQVKLREPYIKKTDVCKVNFEFFYPLIRCKVEKAFDCSICRSEKLFWLVFLVLCGMKCMF